MYADHITLNQALRLRVGEETLKGLIVNMGEDAMLVASTSQTRPEVEPGTPVRGEIFTPEGLYHFSSKLLGVQLMPVLVLILERPRAMRRVQRRREQRHEVSMPALLVFISAERTINTPVEVSNLSFSGAEVLAPEAPPVGTHCVLLMRQDEAELSAIVRTIHASPIEGGQRIGFAFVEMSRTDTAYLNQFVALLAEAPGGSDARR
ncbi:MAG: PilZ domain-containing protein [Candidatus Sericytochromatia bacterium]|nr:PilZ domain-containing protein [Candidatus Sericytochromatia bacterium]